LALAYGSGLRVSEVVNLKAKDIDLDRNLIVVREGKGGKDRIALLPEKLLGELRILVGEKEGREILFESERGGKLTTRTAQKVFEQALNRAGILKEASFHSLRRLRYALSGNGWMCVMCDFARAQQYSYHAKVYAG
jgi:integrase